ncbi:sulfite reductase [Candidatus Falkowbacteria bacterium RIFOXYB2_FULL_34_18]|uniref:Sulfite reductase n=1 Tax=Candidatus Falkowbacteria bacterium RIFOXYD2_FULL_34_120 TaxID=1798007 RepID=A0A1F5TPX0_9BACT|nr:MAG: sulfite reductase [Candidatus Falkowbacteria bacterium RIFOXYB2_FULL_34_18]OGF29348.1 MAG: sulfite reductase [Candidatus Falkowbacteria bacterium RIFOXYC12_FULL_34_55]OGF36539.1 MAG: sulfite reductase [Candidatus Falkowbacteria bacterium RIFOXYC2_FULL_34_220]OGF38771.1 MAG: sulfite reductase [Candidatus Falkowbacteria bacterium RIFOXYD12_FULL_34_57]OGF41012.1 MAG: sulfite reductase [Candidatus Falkowbacteria bacterium RIFOXYD2_FULL_34_120]
MDYNEAKQKIVEFLEKKKDIKTKFYFNDLVKVLGIKPREAKKFINQMVSENILVYWSSGSTTMYGLQGAGKQAKAENEE